jgi:hypothetical protein
MLETLHVAVTVGIMFAWRCMLLPVGMLGKHLLHSWDQSKLHGLK